MSDARARSTRPCWSSHNGDSVQKSVRKPKKAGRAAWTASGIKYCRLLPILAVAQTVVVPTMPRADEPATQKPTDLARTCAGTSSDR